MDREAVEQMISHYNDIFEKFDNADVILSLDNNSTNQHTLYVHICIEIHNLVQILLLKHVLENVEKHIQPGVTRLNWCSMNIKDYATSCSNLLKSLSSVVVQITRIRQELDSQIDNVLSKFNLFASDNDPEEPNYEIRSCKVCIEFDLLLFILHCRISYIIYRWDN